MTASHIDPPVSEETLMAYADGELDASARAQVEAVLATDPSLVQKLSQQRILRTRLQSAFDPVMNEPVPQHLLDAARSIARPDGVACVTPLAQVRQERAAAARNAQRRWSWPQWSAMAASIVLGVIAAQLLRVPQGLLDDEVLNHALNTQLAANQSADAPVQVGLTFRAGSGEYCRTFALRDGSELAGLACRQGDAWQVEVMERTTGAATGMDGYRMAGGALPPAVLKAMGERIAGEPLDAAAEASAREARWATR